MKKIFLLLFIGVLSFTSCKKEATPSQFNITVQDLPKLKIDNPQLIILDVRTPEEISNGKIDSKAVEMDYFDDGFKARLETLDQSKSYLVYCKSGGRSSKTQKQMSELGFKNVYNLIGGYKAWIKNN